MNRDWIIYLPIYFVRDNHISVFTLLYGLLRVLNIGSVGVMTICGVTVVGWKPSLGEQDILT